MNKKAYLAINKNNDIVQKSSSGGLFSAIVDAICKENFVVYGAEFNENFDVVHSFTTSVSETVKYRKSKYVESNIKGCYKSIKNQLDKGISVLFTGAPCQVSGLLLSLKRPYDNLFCVDFACHGVPGVKVFESYKKYLKEKYGGDLSDFSFRYKTLDANNKWQSRNIKATINGKTIIENNLINPYLRGYHSGLFYKAYCYKCKYASPIRVSDITMADFWSIQKLYPKINPHKGASALIVNSSKGESILNELSKYVDLTEVEYSHILNNTGAFNVPTSKHRNTDFFLNNLDKIKFDELIELSLRESAVVKITRTILASLLSKKSKYRIKKIIFAMKRLSLYRMKN